MKVLLVVPPWSFRDIRSEETRSIAGAWPPPGLMYVGAVLRDHGYQVHALEGFFYGEEEFLDEIRRYEPDVLGIYTITTFWHKARWLAREVKRVLPRVFVVSGGHYPSALRENCLEEEPALDAVVVNEGEFACLEMVTRLAGGESLEGVPGTIVRRNGRIVTNPPRPLIDPLDQLPIPAVDLFPWKRYRPSYGQVLRLPAFQVVSSRGCTNACLYCYKMYGRTIRTRTPGHVVNEIDHYVRAYGAREIKFWDESFTYDRARVFGICEEILRRGLDVTWWVSARADMVDEELLRIMKKAGCWCINYGVESAVPKNLETLRKNLTIEQIEAAVRLTHRLGIRTYLTYVFGTPGETYEEGLKTIDFARRMNSFYAEFFPITPWPGTDMWGHGAYGRMIRPVSEMTMLQDNIAFVPHSMSEEQLARLLKLAYRRVYLRPRFILGRILAIRSWYQVKIIFFGGLALLSMLFQRGKTRAPGNKGS